MDGWVIIGTDLDTKPLDKRLRKLEAQLENEEISLKVKASDIEETKRQLKEVEITMRNISKANEEPANRLKTLSKQYNTFNQRIAEGERLTTDEYHRYGYIDNEIAKLQSIQQEVNQEMDKYNTKFNKLNDSLTKAEAAYDKQKNKIAETKQQIIDLNDQIKKNKLQEVQDKLRNVGKSTESIVKKVLRWGLALFSIRSGYMFIRQAMSTLSQYNEKMGADMEYIRWALANTLKPIIEYIMVLTQKLVAYIIYIGKAWGLISKEADFSAKAFDKAKKSIGGANKQAKELRKTLAGFDEMNILNENGSVGSLGSSGFVTPSFDLGKMEDIPIPNWIKWIAKNKKTILRILGAIAGVFVGIKKGYGAVKTLGIGLAIEGLIRSIQKIIDFIKDPSFDNFIGILEGIALAVTGVAIAVGAWPIAFAGAIAFVVIEIVKNFDKIKELFNKLLDWMDTNFLGKLKNIFGPVGNLIYLPFENTVKLVKILFEGLFGGIKKIVDGIVKIFQGDFWGGIKLAFSGVLDIMLTPFYALVEGVKIVVDRLKTFFGDLFTWLKDKFVNPLKTKFDSLINKLKEILGLEKKANVTGGGGAGGFGGGTSGGRAKGGIFYPSRLPRLAKGGIVNMPGPGIPYHGAVIGERGAEAVVPLTDSQQMSLLGATIGKNVTIAATIPVYVGNRQVAREIRKIEASDKFAFNG